MWITGADVAEEAFDMVLTDDNFASIVNAAEEGRGICSTIKQFVQYALSSIFGERLVIFLALGLGPFGKDIMNKLPRKRDEEIISKDVIYNILYSRPDNEGRNTTCVLRLWS